MAIKTVAEIFGDGSAGNPQVPIDLNAPPGFNALSRGVAFGEQVTSAIKNRTPYSLALNDEDLNTRLVDFEVRGLDGAYDLGTLGPAGGGRIINKDSGAVETVSLLAALYGDDAVNAHYRANMSGDFVDGGTGFDAVAGSGRKSPGYIDRVAVGLADANGTVIDGTGNACTLASGGTNRVRLDSGGQWKLGTVTQLTILREVIEISGGLSAENGLYVLATLLTDDTAELVRLDGTAATFTAGPAVATLYRRKFASSQYAGDGNKGGLFHGVPGGYTALTLLAGKSDVGDSGGATNALRAPYKRSSGALLDSMLIDLYGRIVHNLSSEYVGTAINDLWGTFGHLVDKSGSNHPYEAGFIFRGADADNNYAFVALTPIDNGALDESETFAFPGAPDQIDVTGATNPFVFQTTIAKGMTTCYISWPANQIGYYYVDDKVGAGTTVVQLRKLDGTTPSFPGTGTGVVTFFSGGVLGKRSLSNMDSPTGLSFPTDVRPALTLAGAEDDSGEAAGGLYIGVPFATDAIPIACYAAGNGITDDSKDRLLFGVTSQGFGYLFNDLRIDGDYRYNVPPARTTSLALNGVPEYIAGAPAWSARNAWLGSWRSEVSEGDLMIPLILPHGAVLNTITVVFDHSIAPTIPNTIRLYRRTVDFVTPTPGVAADQIGADEVGVVGTAVQRHVMGSIGETVDAGTTLILRISASNGPGFDTLYGIQLDWTDPGPSNH